MLHIRLEAVGLAYEDGIPVLDDVTLELPRGWTGVVGENGAGKTTLLRALTGELTPSVGHIHRSTGPVAFVAQRVDAPDPSVEAFAADWSKASRRWRARLDLEDDGLTRWPTLSQGQRKRWQIAAALAARPDLLVLDEPSNHLDAHARAVLLDALRAFEGVGVIVSHDRALLEALAPRTAFVAEGRVQVFDLAYGAARKARATQLAAQASAREQAKRAARRAATQLDAARREAAAAARSKSARVRMKSVKDRDAASVSAKHRSAKAEAALSKRAASLNHRAAAIAGALPEGPSKRAVGGEIRLEAKSGGPRRLVQLEQVRLTAGPKVLIPSLDLGIERVARLRLAGANGAGKSTLLRLVAERARGAVAYVEQDPGEAVWARTRAELSALDPERRGRVLQLAAAFGADPEDLLSDRPLTPGQAQKLALSATLGRPYDLVLLDEPTNHLDLPAIERLQDALQTFEGAIVLVTHDEALAEATTEVTLHIEAGALRIEQAA